MDAWAATRDQILEVDAANLGYPVYFERASGAHVWDVDGNRFIDFNLGYGPVVLGHAEPRVLDAVVRQMAQGTCASPLWHPRQVELAELMTEVIPGAEQAYLLRTGSDATTAAVRLARIHTGRDKVLRWGYNGWHDWCAPRPEGVPDPTLSSVEHADVHLQRHRIGPERLRSTPGRDCLRDHDVYEYDAPAPGFLNQVKEIANAHGALFILDEMRSGFRIALGGAQEHFGVVGDLSTFSKAMANGYPISAVVGRADVLAHLGRTHMSSTFYGNPAEMAAAITTIGILRETDALARIRRLGETFVDGLTELVRAYEIPAEVVGLPVSPFLIFDESDTAGCDRKVRFFTEVVRRGVLLHPNHQWFLSAAHTEEDVQISLDACRSAFDLISNG